MSGTVHFFREHHLYYRHTEGDSPEDVRQAQAEDIQFLATVDMPVHVLVDARDSVWRPKSLREVKDAIRSMDSPNLRWLIMIMDANPVQQFLVSTSFQIMSRDTRVKIVASLEEARDFLEEKDSTIDIPALMAALAHEVGVTA